MRAATGVIRIPAWRRGPPPEPDAFADRARAATIAGAARPARLGTPATDRLGITLGRSPGGGGAGGGPGRIRTCDNTVMSGAF